MEKTIVVAEVQRKLFHSLMVLVAIVNWIGGPLLSIGFTGICVAFFLGFDFIRIRVYGYFPFRGITDRVMRPAERTRLGASVYFAVGTLFIFLSLHLISHLLLNFQIMSYWMLSGWLAVAAVIVAAIGDGAAAIIGLLWGRHRLRGSRTVEGSIGGSIIGFLAFLPFWYFFGIHWVYGIIAASMLIAVDVVEVPLNDNLLNPVVIGYSLAIVEIISVVFFNLGVA